MLYLRQKWSDCHETKSKHISWTQGLKCDHQVWPWPWPWPLIFKVKYGICYISAKSGPIATKQKANISIELQASNVTNVFDLDHNLDLWILKVKRDLHRWPHTSPLPWIFMVKFWNSCISEWEGRLTLHKGGGSRSFMTMGLPDSDRGDYSCRRAVNSSSYIWWYSVYINIIYSCTAHGVSVSDKIHTVKIPFLEFKLFHHSVTETKDIHVGVEVLRYMCYPWVISDITFRNRIALTS